jgi:hypothetical protein
MKIRDFINRFMLPGSAWLSKTTQPSDISSFLETVWPIRTEHELVRIGGDADGGYLVPNDLEGVGVCFSPGVAATCDFEEDCARRGIRSFMADYSVDGPPTSNPLFRFEKKYLGSRDDQIFTTLESWIERSAPGTQDMLLQMDIEGGEYPVLLSTSRATLKRFRTIVVEFHSLELLAERSGFRLIDLAFARLTADFDVVHAHVNNCTAIQKYKGFELPPVMEFTFHRKDRSHKRVPATHFPHPLDRGNLPQRRDTILPACWRS